MQTPEGQERRDRILKEAFQHRDALLTQAFAMLRDWGSAEDVVQDAFLVVVNKSDQFQEGTSVYAWSRQIVRNKALEAIRKRARQIPVEEDQLQSVVSETLDAHLTLAKAEDLRERREALEDCMSKLKKLPLDLLVGFYWQRQSCQALAQTHRRSENSIRLMLSRTRKQLRGCVDRFLRPSGVQA
jgi:RNA polymerase sigma-70 factor (ECF subfamily)